MDNLSIYNIIGIIFGVLILFYIGGRLLFSSFFKSKEDFLKRLKENKDE
jgi:uncharacterized membrane protein YdjX (TVP38/TMEM64 family)